MQSRQAIVLVRSCLIRASLTSFFSLSIRSNFFSTSGSGVLIGRGARSCSRSIVNCLPDDILTMRAVEELKLFLRVCLGYSSCTVVTRCRRALSVEEHKLVCCHHFLTCSEKAHFSFPSGLLAFLVGARGPR